MTILQRLVVLLEADGHTGYWEPVQGLTLLGKPVEEAYTLLTFGEGDAITLAVTDEGESRKRIHQTAELAHESRVYMADETAFADILRDLRTWQRTLGKKK